eukprot:Em0013g208a
MKLSWQECADTLLVSHSTLWHHLKELKVMLTFSDITDADLDAVVEAIQHSSPRSGAVMVMGCTEELWVVIHGGIDGYSRQVVYLGASNNNKSKTVLQLFPEAYGWPSPVRLDCGGANIEVARCMTSTRGLGQHSGSSAHNQRMFRCVCHLYYPCSMKWKLAIYCLPSAKLTCSAYIPRINAQLKTFARLEQPPHAYWTWIVPYANVDEGLDCFPHSRTCIRRLRARLMKDSANAFDEGSVTVPAVPNQFNHDQLQYLALQHDPLKPSNYHGFDLYLAVN